MASLVVKASPWANKMSKVTFMATDKRLGCFEEEMKARRMVGDERKKEKAALLKKKDMMRQEINDLKAEVAFLRDRSPCEGGESVEVKEAMTEEITKTIVETIEIKQKLWPTPSKGRWMLRRDGGWGSAERRSQSQATDRAFPSRRPAILSIEGKTFTVQIFYKEEPVSDYVRAAVSTVTSIHKLEPPGDILVFMTGQEEVDETVQVIQYEAEDRDDLVAFPLYAGLSHADQERVFSPLPRGKRKVIVATNIAETSLTLEGIVYVVDSGFSKQRFYNPIKDVEALITAPISRASAQQRAGRAGRVRPGKCYRLYTEDAYSYLMSGETVPEIQRSNLTSTILQLKALGIDNIMRFDWLASPAPEAMVRALETIFAIGAIDSNAKLTSPTGFQTAEIPLHPMLGKTLIASCTLGCALEMVTIAAALSVQSIWVPSRGRQKELDEVKFRFAAAEGDHITYLNVFEGFLQSQKSAQWCHRNLINYQALKKVEDIRSQLSKLLQRLGLPVKSCDKDVEVLQKAIATGFFANACQLKPSGERGCYKRIRDGEEVFLHPSSVLFRPLHAMAHVLHPLWRSEDQFECEELDEGFQTYVQRWCGGDVVMLRRLEDDLLAFRNNTGNFTRATAKLREMQLQPVSWWEKYGNGVPTLLLELAAMDLEPMQVNVDKIDIEKVRDIPTIPQEERDLYTLLYEEASTLAHDTRGTRRGRGRPAAASTSAVVGDVSSSCSEEDDESHGDFEEGSDSSDASAQRGSA
ncbi:hypothetical protein L7F22_030166 [Adiantum nelumboides]|nr:hypothetical protein [Adiantum nelumboides]